MPNNRLPGHELLSEGKTLNGYRERVSNLEGSAKCSCGMESPVIKNTAQRKVWHKDHKDDLRQGGDGAVWQGVSAEES